MKKLVLVSISSVLFAACAGRSNDPISAAKTAAKDPKLQGSWAPADDSKRCSSNFPSSAKEAIELLFKEGGNAAATSRPASYSTEYRFEGDAVTRKYVYHNEAGCKGKELVSFEERGTFDPETDGNKAINGAMPLDMHFKKAFVKVVSEEGLAYARGTTLCGLKDYEKGKERDVTPQAKEASCLGVEVPRDVFTVYKIEGDKDSIMNLGEDRDTSNKPETRSGKVFGLRLKKK